MNKFLLFTLFVVSSALAEAQQFQGQWKGFFTDKSTSFQGWGGDQCEYVLEIETRGSAVSGYSYTYFTEGGKRYFTICKLTGHLNSKKKYIEVRETERTKTNVPVTIRNCFQVHKLFYERAEGSEAISGEWIPAPQQSGDCGYGYTYLERRSLQAVVPGYNRSMPPKANTKKPPVASQKAPIPPVKKVSPLAKATNPPVKKASPLAKAPVKKYTTPKTPEKALADVNKQSQPTIAEVAEPRKKMEMIPPATSFKNRDLEVLKTIYVYNPVIKVNVYDNAEVDGDSISLYFNGKMILQNKRLCEKGHLMELAVDTDRTSNELIMHAENLGTIPPNTAIMVVTDGAKRYEVRISSDLKKSGVIRFVYSGAENAAAAKKP